MGPFTSHQRTDARPDMLAGRQRDLGHRRMAIAASSLLFAAIHGSLALMLPLTVLAVVLVWLYEKTGSIIAPILMHAAFNAVNFAMIKLIPQIAQ